MKTKTYYLIITILALIGLTLFENYPIVIAISAFGIGIGYREYTQEDKEEVKEEVKESNMPGHRNPPPPPEEVNHPYDN
jgi:flagellar biosynthesis protein FlhB